MGLPETDDRRKRRYTRTLRKLYGVCGILPTSYMLPEGGVEIVGQLPRSSGGFADVWIGKYGDIDVAVKVLRLSENDDIDKIKKVGHLRPNVLFLMMSTGIWQRGVGLEIFVPSKRALVSGCGQYPTVLVLYGLILDVKWERC